MTYVMVEVDDELGELVLSVLDLPAISARLAIKPMRIWESAIMLILAAGISW
jgi:hypothetical protein